MDVSVGALNRHIAAELRAESARQGYIQKDVSAAIGISQGTMSTKWNGKVPLVVGEFVAWCDLLDAPVGLIIQRAHDAAVDEMARDMIADGRLTGPRDFGLAAHRPGTEPGTETDEGHTP